MISDYGLRQPEKNEGLLMFFKVVDGLDRVRIVI
jgi:hypothetical protein